MHIYVTQVHIPGHVLGHSRARGINVGRERLVFS